MELFNELTTLIFLATIFALIMRYLKQPLIVGYILAGILAGPHFFNLIHSKESIEVFSKMGITVLLFIVGLNLNPKVLKEIGKVSLITGIGQIILTTTVGFILALMLGLDRIAALYIAIALTFSSTIIILKLLSDKGDLHKLYGKLAIGFLLVQDIVASIILLLISSFNSSSDTDLTIFILQLILKGLALFIILYVISGYVLPRFSKFIAASQEVLFLFSLSWGLGLASIFHFLGFSVEIGALIAGVMLSLTPFAYETGSRLKPLRDFFIVVFFVSLGSQLVFNNVEQLLVPVFFFSLFVLIGNPIILIIIMNLLGFKRKTNFMTGIAIAQISEFSLILATLGFNAGHIDSQTLSIITMVALITIPGSTYLILSADKIYKKVENLLYYIELRKSSKKNPNTDNENYQLILFGYDRAGEEFLKAFKKLDKPYLVVDFNPDSINKLNNLKIPNRYGDAEDVEFLEELNFSQVKLIVSTIPDLKTNLLLTKSVKAVNPRTIIIILSFDLSEANNLYEQGATYVVIPHYLGAKHIVNLISKAGLDSAEFKEEREKHLEYLNKKYEHV